MSNCCEDWGYLRKNYNNLFVEDDAYGWILSWIELTEEAGYTQVHKYGIKINYCPICGKKLLDKKNT